MKKPWKQIKQELLDSQQYIEEQNGTTECKVCSTNFRQLISDIEDNFIFDKTV